jgi:hypothetical protein
MTITSIPSFVTHWTCLRRAELSIGRQKTPQIPRTPKHDAFETRVVQGNLCQHWNPKYPKNNRQNDIAPVEPGRSRHEEQPAKHRQQEKQFPVAPSHKLLTGQTAMNGNALEFGHFK